MAQNIRERVLVTGISGFIGLHCAKELLNQGFEVRGSVRDMKKADEVLITLAAASVDTRHLTFVQLDLTSDEGWNDAAEGCDYIMHIASPFTIANPKTEAEMITPAVEGSLRALRAGENAGVKRVVLTSSIVAMMGSMKTGTFGPSDWTDSSSSAISTYTKSKTLAERAAWEFVENLPDSNTMEFVTLNPGGVFGPPLGTNITGQTMAIVDQMLNGKLPLVPNIAFPMVDVRDLAVLHVQAMITPKANGKRILAAGSAPSSFAEMAQILKDEGYKGPSTRIAPDFFLRFMSLFDREAKGMLGMLGMNLSADNAATRSLFGWTPRSVKQSIQDTAKAVSLIQNQ
ncbi:SDR family oxidoreductase [Enterovibrio norvegicus]|uniref:SDR family oxidoreductase n=1 Tax=Enterovibrio norvegicus TaxID=188144 RepID=UPI000C84CFF5|nr:aldehyde reductase [Enterovibrio norvegicus]MCC4799365.1 aldehyde reductase [Enterovibrio norvegicus]